MIDKEKVFCTMFVQSNINYIMQSLDLGDGGTKMFGSFKDISFNTKSEVNEEYIQKLVKHMIEHPDVGYVEIQDYFAFKPNLHSLSLGARFIWIKDYRKQLEAAGMKEVRLDAN